MKKSVNKTMFILIKSLVQKTVLLLFFPFLIFSSAVAQVEFHPGSLYSAFGVGNLQYSASIRTDGMGVQGISLTGNYINLLNPASNTYAKNTQISIGARYGLINVSNEISSARYSDFNVSGMSISIPFWDAYGMVINAGFSPYSLVNYKIVSNSSTGGVNVQQTFGGSGGISVLNFGYSVRPFRYLNLGAEYNYSFGNINELVYFDFNSPNIYSSYYRTENNLKGSFFKAGLIFELGKLFPRSVVLNDFNIGFVYRTKASMKSTIDKIYGSTSILEFDTMNVVTDNVIIPQAFGVGMTKKIGRQLIISTDILFQQWSDFSPGPLLPAKYRDNIRYGIGFEVLPAPKSVKTFWESLSYRAGFSYDNSIAEIEGNIVHNYALNLGLNFPINNENSVDFAIQAGIRGNKDKGLVKDQYLKFSLGLNFGEFWFLRTREEDK